MSPRDSHQPHDAGKRNAVVSERAPLLPSPSDNHDGLRAKKVQASQDDSSISSDSTNLTKDGFDPKQAITLSRAAICAVALSCLIFLQATNISLLTTTQSRIAEEFDSFEKVSWFTSSYLIAMSAVSPLMGKLASVFAPGVCIFASTVILSIGVLACSVANGFGLFILGRVLTGIGASGILTIALIIVLELSSAKHRGLTIALLNTWFTIGVAVGATAAGALLEPIGWRALFWLQSIVALSGGGVLLFAIPWDFRAHTAGSEHDKSRSMLRRLAALDYLGALTLTLSIVLMLYALSSPRKIPILPLVLSAIVLVTFVIIEVYVAQDPIIPVKLLKSRGLLMTCFGTVGFMMARWSVLFYTPTYALAVRQWPPAAAGSILIPTNLGFAVGGLVVGAFHIRRHGSFYFACILVYAIFPISLVSLAMLSNQHTNPWLYVAIVFINGAIAGAALNYTLAHILHLTPKSTHYIATSLAATFRGFAGSFGSAIGGGIFTRTLHASLEDGFAKENRTGARVEELIRRLLGSPALVERLDDLEKEVAIHGYEHALKVLWLAGAGLSVAMIFVQAGAGWSSGEEAAETDGMGKGDVRGVQAVRDEEQSNH
ncbi:MFS general substrate transporter [Polychaeton citri CBS 116435]|uniref:MFS general substrate transporter n=1 Tax=Polychaeton citri CBS 116435 TaxID=1314669 RepID=A0A9P4URT6_9PEZI|nr:MFS general substrate transporter [Polychaeton citri CBS 116435]